MWRLAENTSQKSLGIHSFAEKTEEAGKTVLHHHQICPEALPNNKVAAILVMHESTFARLSVGLQCCSNMGTNVRLEYSTLCLGFERFGEWQHAANCKQASRIGQRAADEVLTAFNEPGIEENHGCACGLHIAVVLDASVFESKSCYDFVHLSASSNCNVFCSGFKSWHVSTQASQLPAKKSQGDGRTIALHGMLVCVPPPSYHELD